MKKASGIINIVLLILVCILFFLHFDSKKITNEKFVQLEKKETPVIADNQLDISKEIEPEISIDTASIKTQDGNIVYYDQEVLFKKSKWISGLINDISNKTGVVEQEFKLKQQAFEKTMNDLNTQSQTATEFDMQRLQGQAQSEQQIILEAEQNAKTKLEKLNFELNQKVENRIMKVIDKIQESAKFDYVLVRSEYVKSVFSYNESLNITESLIKGTDGK
jgi:hypothetical protein